MHKNMQLSHKNYGAAEIRSQRSCGRFTKLLHKPAFSSGDFQFSSQLLAFIRPNDCVHHCRRWMVICPSFTTATPWCSRWCMNDAIVACNLTFGIEKRNDFDYRCAAMCGKSSAWLSRMLRVILLNFS